MLRADYVEVVGRALSEDLGPDGEITSDSVIPEGSVSRGVFVARSEGGIAGMDVAAYVFEALDHVVTFDPLVEDGDRIPSGGHIAVVDGPTGRLPVVVLAG